MVENKNLEELRKELEQAKQEKLQVEHQLQRKKNQLSYRERFSKRGVKQGECCKIYQRT